MLTVIRKIESRRHVLQRIRAIGLRERAYESIRTRIVVCHASDMDLRDRLIRRGVDYCAGDLTHVLRRQRRAEQQDTGDAQHACWVRGGGVGLQEFSAGLNHYPQYTPQFPDKR